jgi:hypothetical protein
MPDIIAAYPQRAARYGGPILSIPPALSEATKARHLLVIYPGAKRFEEFGEDRLLEVVKAHRDLPPDALIEEAFKSVKQHTGDAPRTDDMTIVVLKVE